MSLKRVIDAVLKEQGRNFKWLVEEMGVSNDGLKMGLINETLKLKDLKKLLTLLNLPLTIIFEAEHHTQKSKGNYVNQAIKSTVNEPDVPYKKEVEVLRERIIELESRLRDKEEIIELLRKQTA